MRLRFAPEAAPDAASFLFHPGQTVTENDDGSLPVRLSAGGTREMCWHLFTWRTRMTVEGTGMKDIKDILRQRHDLDLTRDQIAAATGVSAGTVSHVLERAAAAGLSWPLGAPAHAKTVGFSFAIDRLRLAGYFR